MICRYLALRASLLPIDMLNSLGKFHATTAAWLMQVYLNTEPVTENNVTSYAPKEFKKVELPIPDDVPDTVRSVRNTKKYFLLFFKKNIFFV